MPIKKLKFSFEVGVEALTQILTEGHSTMDIEVVEDVARTPKLPRPPEPLALPPPSGRGGRKGIKEVVLGSLRSGRKVDATELKAVLKAAGYSVNSLPNQLHQMKAERLVKSVGVGLYVITKKGARL
jgi:hypothetical protein